jgi:cell division transport system permease protein
MALKVDYVVREAGINLRRNLTLGFATMVTIAIALSLVGAALLMQRGVENANVRFHGDIQTIVYMQAKATQDQVDAVGRAIDTNPHVKSKRYLDHDAAYAEFQQLFFDQPEIVKSLTAAETPTSFKLQLKDADASVVQSLQEQFKTLPAVYEVIAPTDQVKKQEDGLSKISLLALLSALIVGATSLVLIVNSIRIAMFARRREIEVMKLVGATNWFIRIPFMAEGLIQGILGSAIGIGFVSVLRTFLLPTLVDSGGPIWANFHVSSQDMRFASIWLIIAGALVGIFGSAVAATRFLDV